MIREKMRKIIAQLLLMYCSHTKNETSYLAYVSKQNSKREKQVILLTIPNRRMALHCSKKVFALFK